MNLPKLTVRQSNIIDLVYRYRFLNRIQIQALMGHKDYKTINLWLSDLRAKQYVEWIYSTGYAERTRPAIYYLGLNGIRKQKEHDLPVEEIRKRYREATRSQTFIDRCLLIADCAIKLERAESKQRGVMINYFFETEADYLSDSYFSFLASSELIRPQLCYQKLVHDHAKEARVARSYLLEVFDPTLPRYRIKKRLSNYIEYLDNDDWEEESEDNNLPIIQFVCPRTSDLIYAKRRTRGLLAESWEYDDEDRPYIRFTTIDKLKQQGILAKEIWEEA